MMTMEKNAKRKLVDDYIRKYSPYKSQPLGVNVSAILKLAEEKGCPVREVMMDNNATKKILKNRDYVPSKI